MIEGKASILSSTDIGAPSWGFYFMDLEVIHPVHSYKCHLVPDLSQDAAVEGLKILLTYMEANGVPLDIIYTSERFPFSSQSFQKYLRQKNIIQRIKTAAG